jgi:hypothetical protein
MWDATSGLANLEAATKPMDSGLVNDEMDIVLEEQENNPGKKLYCVFSTCYMGEI